MLIYHPPVCYIYRYSERIDRATWIVRPDDVPPTGRPNSNGVVRLPRPAPPSSHLVRQDVAGVTIEMTDVLTGNIATPRCRMSSAGSRD